MTARKPKPIVHSTFPDKRTVAAAKRLSRFRPNPLLRSMQERAAIAAEAMGELKSVTEFMERTLSEIMALRNQMATLVAERADTPTEVVAVRRLMRASIDETLTQAFTRFRTQHQRELEALAGKSQQAERRVLALEAELASIGAQRTLGSLYATEFTGRDMRTARAALPENAVITSAVRVNGS